MEMNKSIDLVRRNDWWDKDNPAWMGLWNFDRYHFVVVQDLNLALEKAKAGELDYYPVNKSQWWVEELVPTKVDAIKRGGGQSGMVTGRPDMMKTVTVTD